MCFVFIDTEFLHHTPRRLSKKASPMSDPIQGGTGGLANRLKLQKVHFVTCKVNFELGHGAGDHTFFQRALDIQTLDY